MDYLLFGSKKNWNYMNTCFQTLVNMPKTTKVRVFRVIVNLPRNLWILSWLVVVNRFILEIALSA